MSFVGNFTIAGGDPLLDSSYPFEMVVTSNDSHLFVGVKVAGVFRNPHDGWNASTRETSAEWVHLLLTTEQRTMQGPLDAIFLANFRRDRFSGEDGFWNGTDWKRQSPTEIRVGGLWRPGFRGVAAAGDTDQLSWEFILPRTSPITECDGFQVPGEEPFGLRLLFVRQGGPGSGDWDFSDHFPRTGPPPGDSRALDDWLWFRFSGATPTVGPHPEIPCRELGY